jgi:hypothetical protein
MAYDDNNNERAPHSDSNVSLRLADIQRRCAQLLDDPEGELELAVEEPDAGTEPHDYYVRD